MHVTNEWLYGIGQLLVSPINFWDLYCYTTELVTDDHRSCLSVHKLTLSLA